MIKVLGTKRIGVLGIMLAVNAVLASAAYLYSIPQASRLEKQVNSAQSQLNAKRSEIDMLVNDYAEIQKQQSVYNLLKNDGFFTDQNRLEVEKLLKKIEAESGVISAEVKLKRGVIKDNRVATEAKHSILESPVEIDIEAMDDRSIYKYIYFVEQLFPGHVSTESLVFKRVGEVNSTVLRGVVGGSDPVLMEAKVVFLWRTLIPKKQEG